MADLGSITFEGQSGTRYGFRAYTFDHPLRRVGAVYAVLHSVPKPGGGYVMNPLYFGQTGDITVRFEGHHRQQCFQRNDSNSIAFHVDEDEVSRRAKETDLIRRWDPQCNRT